VWRVNARQDTVEATPLRTLARTHLFWGSEREGRRGLGAHRRRARLWICPGRMTDEHFLVAGRANAAGAEYKDLLFDDEALMVSQHRLKQRKSTNQLASGATGMAHLALLREEIRLKKVDALRRGYHADVSTEEESNKMSEDVNAMKHEYDTLKQGMKERTELLHELETMLQVTGLLTTRSLADLEKPDLGGELSVPRDVYENEDTETAQRLRVLHNSFEKVSLKLEESMALKETYGLMLQRLSLRDCSLGAESDEMRELVKEKSKELVELKKLLRVADASAEKQWMLCRKFRLEMKEKKDVNDRAMADRVTHVENVKRRQRIEEQAKLEAMHKRLDAIGELRAEEEELLASQRAMQLAMDTAQKKEKAQDEMYKIAKRVNGVMSIMHVDSPDQMPDVYLEKVAKVKLQKKEKEDMEVELESKRRTLFRLEMDRDEMEYELHNNAEKGVAVKLRQIEKVIEDMLTDVERTANLNTRTRTKLRSVDFGISELCKVLRKVDSSLSTIDKAKEMRERQMEVFGGILLPSRPASQRQPSERAGSSSSGRPDARETAGSDDGDADEPALEGENGEGSVLSPREEEVEEAKLLGTDWLESDRRLVMNLIECSVLVDVLQDHAKHKAVVIEERLEARRLAKEAAIQAAAEAEIERKRLRAEALAEGRAPPTGSSSHSPRSPLTSRGSSAGSTRRIQANDKLNVRVRLPGVDEESEDDEDHPPHPPAKVLHHTSLKDFGLSSESDDDEEEVVSRDAVFRRSNQIQRRQLRAEADLAP